MSPSENFATLRNRLLNDVLFAAAVVAIPSVIFSVGRAALTDWPPLVILQCLLLAILWGLWGWRARLDYSARAAGFLAVCWVAAFVGLVHLGPVADSKIYVVLAAFAGMLFLDASIGWQLVLFSSLYLAVLGYTVSHGFVEFDLDYASYAKSPLVWFNLIWNIAAYSAIVAYIGWRMVHGLRERETTASALAERQQKITAQLPGVVYQYQLSPYGHASFPYISGALWDIFGCVAETLREDAAPAFDAIDPEDRADVQDSLNQSAQQLSEWRKEFRIQHPEKGLLWVESRATPERLADGATLWHGFLTDVSSRKHAEAAMRQANQQEAVLATLLRFALENQDLDALLPRVLDEVLAVPWLCETTRGCIVLTDAQTGAWITKASCNFSADWLNQCPRNNPDHCAYRGAAQAGPVPWEGDHVSATICGEGALNGLYNIPLRCGMQTLGFIVLCLPAGRPRNEAEMQFLNAVADVIAGLIQKKRVEAALQAAKRMAEEANQAKTAFLANISHDLRTPLNAILGFAQLLDAQKGEVNSAMQAEAANHILSGSRHLLDLIDEVLDLARIESGELDISVEAVPLEPLLHQAELLIHPAAAARGIHISRTAYPELAIRADAKRSQQILLNFLSNAVKYNRPQGMIGIACRVISGQRVRITITDTGIGIPETRRGEIFQPFHRLGAEGGPIEGTGIGLVICKRLVEAMQGEIGFESEIGIGSRFWMELPLAFPVELTIPEIDPPPSCPEPLPDAPCGRVVYIEDHPANIRLMTHALRELPGLELLTATHAEEGLALIRYCRPDLVLLDINLPDMNGFQVLRILRADITTAQIPVIAVSASAMSNDIKAGLEAGFVAYLTKPFRISELLTLIGQTLGCRPFGRCQTTARAADS